MQPNPLRFSVLSLALATALSFNAHAQDATQDTASERVTASSTSNTTAAYDTKRVQKLDKVSVTGNKDAYVLGGGNMVVQTAPKAISTVTREAIQQAAGGSNFTQLISSIPGVDAASDDATGLANGNYSLRGFDSSAIGITVNGAPVTDSGSYSIYATEYGDAENYNDITVMQGTPNVDAPEMGATGGQIAWSTVDPTHDFGVDFNQGFGSNDYRRTFLRVNTGDTGPVRSWVSISKNTADKWKGLGDFDVLKIDGKSLWQIDDGNSVSFSFQYNRQSNFSYYTQSKSAIAQDYEADYATAWGTGTTSYYNLRRNPYRSLLASLDGEFTLSDTLRLSVVPYVWWGDGGGNSSPSTITSRNGYYTADGALYTGIAGKYSASKTVRPGVIAKFFQDIGDNNSLVYGAWYDRSRKSQHQNFVTVDQSNGDLCDTWGDDDNCQLYYSNGDDQVQTYRAYTVTTVQKYFIQDNWTPTDQLTVNLGISLLKANRKGWDLAYPGGTTSSTQSAYFDSNYTQSLPALGVKYQVDDQNQLFFGAAKSFRVPATSSIYTNQFATTEEPKPEEAWTYDLGWRFYGDRLGAALMVYQSDYKNKSISSYDEDDNSVYITIPNVRMRGFNGEASYKVSDSLKLYGSYTHTQAEMKDPYTYGGVDYPTDGKQLPNTPKDLFTLALNYEQGDFWAGLKGRYSGARYGDYMNTEKVGSYTTVGLDAGYNFADWGALKKPYLKLNISNLTDKQAITWASSTTLMAVAADGFSRTGTPYYNVLEPRAVMFTIGASF
ncbi:iron complex outermembrane recepter protein [Pseudoxanthomonas sp. GM95]|nr:iron complex outermembrane recepter protein [Pseudoxanthomonas sp. GM95]